MSEFEGTPEVKTITDNPKQAQLTKKSKNAERREQADKILKTLFKKYPKCFIPYHIRKKKQIKPNMPRPLVLDIKHYIHAENPDWPLSYIRMALSIYVQGRPYLTVLRTGTRRIDLQGNHTKNAEVTEEEHIAARAELRKKDMRIKATHENQTNAAASKKKQEEAEKQQERKQTPLDSTALPKTSTSKQPNTEEC